MNRLCKVLWLFSFFFILLIGQVYAYSLDNLSSIYEDPTLYPGKVLPEFDKNKKVLFLGGSFNPPTKGHMKILVDVMRQRNFQKAVIVVDYPYKKTSWPKEVSLYLTRLTVSHLFQFLKEENIAFSSFTMKELGHIFWEEGDKKYEIRVSDVSIKDEGKSIAFDNLKKVIDEEGLKPQQAWALFGADCLQTVKKWEKSTEWFNSMNWIVMNRAGQRGRMLINIEDKDPLRKMLGKKFLILSEHQSDKDHHLYLRKPYGPAVVVFPQSGGNISSTTVRSLVLRKQDKKASDLVLPVVWDEINKFSLYRSNKKQQIVRKFLQERKEAVI